ncbi:MAG: DNA/RNA non-specific endonuclease, partial [Pseudomonadota bacterium]
MKEQQEPVLNWESLDTDGRRELMDTLRGYIRTESYRWFEDPNITSVGVGLKVRTDQASGQAMETDEVSLQFTVGEKKDLVSLESDESALLIPERIDVDGVEIVTDVLVRTYEPKHLPVSAESFRESDPKRRQETLRPGLSLGNEKGGTGTLGLIVYDQANGTPYMLSNWHVIHGLFGEIGDTVVQPGKRDDNGVRMNAAGRLVRSYLDIAGDCAIASIEGRAFDQRPLGLDVIPDEMVRVEIGDRVIKSGRTTHVTYGIVRRVDVNVRINYKGEQGEKIIGGFEIGIDQDNRPQDGEVSRGGDSGAAWLIANGEQATSLVAGLHFAGESDFVDDEFALANYPSSVFKKLGIALTKPTLETETAFRAGYDEMFLGVRVGLPRLPEAFVEDAVKYNGLPVLPYTHFSVVQSEAMGFARLVAWNIDGGSIKRVSTNGVRFRL